MADPRIPFSLALYRPAAGASGSARPWAKSLPVPAQAARFGRAAIANAGLPVSLGLFRVGTGGGGTAEPGYDIILIAGQSNAAGRGTLLAGTDDAATSGIDQFDGRPASGTYRTIITAVEPLAHPDGSMTGKCGLGYALARSYLAANPGRSVLLVPAAVGSTSLTSGTPGWQASAGAPNPATTYPGASASQLYNFAIDQANRALAAANAAQPTWTNRIVGTVWVQGENDAAASVSKATYAAGLDALIDGFRTYMTSATSSWFVVGSMLPEFIAAAHATKDPVDLAHRETPSRKAYTAFARMDGGYNSGDATHYNRAGYLALASSVLAAIAKAKLNTTVGAVPGQPTIALTANTNSIDVAITAAGSGAAATGNQLEYHVSGGVWILQDAGSTTAGTLSGLAGSTAYSVMDTPYNNAGLGVPSAVASATTGAGVAAPGLPTFTIGSLTSAGGVATITMGTGGAVTSYDIAFSTDGGTSYGSNTSLTKSASPQDFTIDWLSASTTYKPRVRAVGLGGTTSWVVGSDFTTSAASSTPGAPSVTASSATAHGATAAVTAGSSPTPDTYDYRLSSDGGTTYGTPVTGIAYTGSPQNITLTAAPSGTAMKVQVRAVAGGIAGSWSTAADFTTTGTAPESGAIAHWLFGSDNTGMLDLVTGRGVTAAGTAPDNTNAGYVKTAAGGMHGLKTGIVEAGAQTTCFVFKRRTSTNGQILAGTLDTASKGWAPFRSGTTYTSKRSGQRTETIPGTDGTTWVFYAIVTPVGAPSSYIGASATLNSFGSYVAGDILGREIALGNGYYSGAINDGVEVAEMMIFGSALNVSQLNTVYANSKTRLSGRSITVA